MPSQTGFRTLGILEFDNLYTLDRLFPHSEKTRSHLGNDEIVVGFQFVGVSSFSRAAEGLEGGGRPDGPGGVFGGAIDADDPDFVQANPVWSPDGRWIAFASQVAMIVAWASLPP